MRAKRAGFYGLSGPYFFCSRQGLEFPYAQQRYRIVQCGFSAHLTWTLTASFPARDEHMRLLTMIS